MRNAGSLLQNYRILREHEFRVVGEVYLRIKHNLMALPGQLLSEIKEVHSHPMALYQCLSYLDDKGLKMVESEDTALSAKRISETKQRGLAAIASRRAALIYGLEILDELIASIIVREPKLEDEQGQTQLDLLREQINHIDDELLNLLSNRMQVAREIGRFKKSNNITILQKARWNEIMDKGAHYANAHGLSEAFMIAYLQSVHDESITQQERVMNG